MVIKWDYDKNDRLNFILIMIKWDYGMSYRSKITFKQRKRSSMIEEEDEDAQNNIGDP